MYEQQDLKLVGSRIKAVRISRGMSQADLAVEASVSLPLISNIERGKTGMQLETFVKVAEALQVSADYLLRPDVPEVKAIYQGEFAELLEDCSASEMETILKIVREVKASIFISLNESCDMGIEEVVGVVRFFDFQNLCYRISISILKCLAGNRNGFTIYVISAIRCPH